MFVLAGFTHRFLTLCLHFTGFPVCVCVCVEGVLPVYHHGGAGLLPCSGFDVFLWSDESLEGKPGGAE